MAESRPPAPSAEIVAQREAEAAAATARADAKRNPRLRIASGLAGVLLLMAAMRGDVALRQGWFFAGVMAFVCLAALRELFHLARYRGVAPFTWIAYAFAPVYVFALEARLLASHNAAAGDNDGPLDAAGLILLAAGVLPCFAVVFRKNYDGALLNVAVTWLGMGYVVGFATCYLRVRHLSLPNAWGLDWAAVGMELVFAGVFVTKMGDIGALLTGRRFGRHKLVPRLSPGKTWEGVAGGMLAGMGFMALLITVEPAMALARLGYPAALGLAALLTATGVAGDLVESAFKRDNAAKDAGASVPGFGGVLDLIDSLLPAGPVLYAALALLGAR